MAHFGVRKAKTILTLAGVTAAVGGAFLVPSGDANALVQDATNLNSEGFSCSTVHDGEALSGNRYDITLKSAEAIKTAMYNPESFYKSGGSPCYIDFKWDENTTVYSAYVNFVIDSGAYTFDEQVTGSGEDGHKFVIRDGANVVFNGANGQAGLVSQKTDVRLHRTLDIEEGGKLTVNSGSYNFRFDNDGTVNFGKATLSESLILNSASMTFDGTTYTSSSASHLSRIQNNSKGTLTINSGTYTGYADDYAINGDASLIHNMGTLVVNGGQFKHHASHKTMGATVNGKWRPYKNEPFGIIHTNTGSVTINNASMVSEGSIIGVPASDTTININNGYFEGDYIAAFYSVSSSTTKDANVKFNIKNGVFNSRDTFSLNDAKNISNKQSENNIAAGVYRDENGEVRANFCTGPSCSTPYRILPNSLMNITGGTFSDGENVTPAPGYTKVDVDTDFDGDGENDVRVVPDNRKQGTDMTIPEGETQKPSDADLGGKNPEDLEWDVEKGKDFCTVNEKGEITAVKGGGSCRVTATDPATGEMTYWDITTTTVGNPDTLDKNSIAIFSIAGAAMAGLGSMIAKIKRFGRR